MRGEATDGGEAERLRDIATTGSTARESFEAIYVVHWERSYCWLLRRTRSEAVAEDLAQDVWTKVWRRAGQFSGTTDAEARAWIYRIVRSTFLDWLKRASRPEPEPDAVKPDARPDTKPIVEEFLLLVREWSMACIESFDTELQQEVVRLWWHTQSPKEVRKVLSAKGVRAMPNVSRLVARFRECIQKHSRRAYPDGPPLDLLDL